MKRQGNWTLIWMFILFNFVLLFDLYLRRRDTTDMLSDFSRTKIEATVETLRSRLEFLELGMQFLAANNSGTATGGTTAGPIAPVGATPSGGQNDPLDASPVSSNPPGGVDAAALAGIQLPADPTREQVVDYVRRICEVSSRQTRFTSSDPQIWLLSRVGPENFHVLLQFYDRQLSIYFDRVLGAFAREEHKQAVIEALRLKSGLVRLVVEMGWEADAREVLFSELKRQPSDLPTDWIKAVARLPNPPYDDLLEYLRTGLNKRYTYEALETLPKIDLDASIADVWKRREGRDGELAAIAMAHGHTEAIGELIEALPFEHPYRRHRLLEAIYRHLPVRGGEKEITAWFHKHKDRLRWDAGEREYVTEGEDP